ncbi:MAG: carbohydrate ABC transporter permease [Candidatus Latescibacteria bacterium]|nr:carbohydrate ABC transporter permease [Candidatus Latescibacterota bacterium]
MGKLNIERITIYAILMASSAVMLTPFAWMISSSFKNEYEMFAYPPVWIPNPARWDNYTRAWNALPFTVFLRNTLFIIVGRLIGELLSCSLVAYGFARLRARGKNVLFLLLLATMMLPGQVTMIPLYIGFSRLGWVDTFKPLIVPAFFGAAFYIFMLRQFFLNIPLELDEAAKIDGASHVRIWWNIFLPLAKPPLLAIAIFLFMGTWNDFMGPLIYLQSTEKFVLSIGLQLFRSYGEYATRWDLIMAASVAISIPPLCVFFLSQKTFIRGVALTGLKG